MAPQVASNVPPTEDGAQTADGAIAVPPSAVDPNPPVQSTPSIPGVTPSPPGPEAEGVGIGASESNTKTATGSPAIQSSPNIDPHESRGLGNGAVAGVAIGVLVLGLLIGAAVAFVILKKRASKRHAQPMIAAATDGSRSNASKPLPAEDLKLSQFLLDSTPDREITAELAAITNLLETHVDANYHLQPVQANAANLSNILGDLGVGQQGLLSPVDVTSLALNPQTRRLALRHILSEVIFSSADLHGHSPISTLPVSMASFVRSIPPVEVKMGDSEGKSNESTLRQSKTNQLHTKATSLALTKWRTLSAFLLHPVRSDRSPLSPDEVGSAGQIATLAGSLNAFLEPFVNPDPASRAQQTEHLKAVIYEITKLGHVVLSQPSEWRFLHRTDLSGQGPFFVLTPGLVKIRGKEGRVYQPPKSVVDPVIVRL
ncbi:hypothetical protein jhhlp_006004 [Lomentospora prolificans]|uniref:Uncharacterized protein n=1 Tax=Lomentospora prolificans TaxID=41688 RepID=A0A2N3N4S8_9PEZI|nr:hypothetical protein jhhlp_006004 [Lomentospora prolificans]